MDGAELEGDVLLPGAGPKESVRVHVILSGGGLAAGREGVFGFEASSTVLDAQRQVTELSARGKLSLAMDTPRTVRRLGIKAGLSARGGTFPAGLELSLDASAVRGAGDETYTFNLDRGARRVAELTATLAAGGDSLAGTWKIDGRDTDCSPFLSGRDLPAFQAAGSGQFDCDAGFARVHARGDIGAELEPAWSHSTRRWKTPESVRLTAGFDAIRADHAVRVTRLNVSVAGPGPETAVRSLLPFVLDERTGEIGPVTKSPSAGRRRPGLARRSPSTASRSPSGQRPACGLVVRRRGRGCGIFVPSPSGWIRPSAPRSALPPAGCLPPMQPAASSRAGWTCPASLSVRKGPDGWQLRAAPLKFANGGRALGEMVSAELSLPAGDDRPPTLSGTWQAEHLPRHRGPGVFSRSRLALRPRSRLGKFSRQRREHLPPGTAKCPQRAMHPAPRSRPASTPKSGQERKRSLLRHPAQDSAGFRASGVLSLERLVFG